MQVLLLDDHPLLRSALQAVLMALEPGATVHAAATVEQADAVLRQGPPMDLALLDLHLPDAPGLTVLARWRRDHPAMPVVVISASQNPADVHAALALGARGYIPKSTGSELLTHALRIVLAGGEYIPSLALLRDAEATPPMPEPPGVAHRVRERSARHRYGLPEAEAESEALPAWLSPPRMDAAAYGAIVLPEPAPGLPRLTPRQLQVLELLMQGRSNKLIARQLCLSVETVKDHVASVLRVLGVKSRTQAVLLVSHLSSVPAPGLGTAALVAPAAQR